MRELAGLGVIVLFEEQKIDTAETTGEMLTLVVCFQPRQERPSFFYL